MTARLAGPLAMAALAAVTAAALSACGTSETLVGSATAATPSAATSSPAAAAVTTAPAAAPTTATGAGPAEAGSPPARPGGTQGGARPAGGSGSSTSGTTGSGNGGGVPSAPAPVITSFRVVSQPTCPVRATPGAPFSSPGTPVTIAWSVSGADGAAIAVDNPGLYGAYGASYPAKGQLELPFGCNESGTTTHTFTVWPAGAKGTSKTLTVSARSDG